LTNLIVTNLVSNPVCVFMFIFAHTLLGHSILYHIQVPGGKKSMERKRGNPPPLSWKRKKKYASAYLYTHTRSRSRSHSRSCPLNVRCGNDIRRAGTREPRSVSLVAR
jgi:hypothetical protein